MPVARTADGVDIAYETVGQGPPDVLFMHGWGGSGSYFDETIKSLDRSRLRAITFSFRGHGDSAAGPAYGLDELAADTIAVADAAGVDKALLIGFSMSGKFAQYVAARHPDRVLGQVLVAGCTAGLLPLPDEVLETWYAQAGNAEGMCDLVREYYYQPVREELTEAFGRSFARIPLEALRGTMEAVTNTSFEPAHVPTLVLAGAHDPMFTAEMLRTTVSDPVPGARFEALDANHEIPVELPDVLAARIEAFLAELSGAPEAGEALAGASV